MSKSTNLARSFLESLHMLAQNRPFLAIFLNSVLTAQWIVLAFHLVQAYSSWTVSEIPPQLGGIVLTTVPLAHHSYQPRRLRVVTPFFLTSYFNFSASACSRIRSVSLAACASTFCLRFCFLCVCFNICCFCFRFCFVLQSHFLKFECA